MNHKIRPQKARKYENAICHQFYSMGIGSGISELKRLREFRKNIKTQTQSSYSETKSNYSNPLSP